MVALEREDDRLVECGGSVEFFVKNEILLCSAVHVLRCGQGGRYVGAVYVGVWMGGHRRIFISRSRVRFCDSCFFCVIIFFSHDTDTTYYRTYVCQTVFPLSFDEKILLAI